MPCKGVIGEEKETCTLKQVEWKIKLSTLSTEVGDWYSNDNFSFADGEWFLRIYPGGREKEAQEYISLFLEASKLFDSECNVKYKFGLKKADGCMEILREIDHTFKRIGYAHGYTKFVQKSEILKRKLDFLPNGILTVVCILWRGNGLKVTPEPRRLGLKEIEKLSKNFKDLLVDKKSCDVTLEVKGKTFEVHKAVLIARSPVLRAMFEHEMMEKKTGTVVIPDCDENSFSLFLEYLYTGEVNHISFSSALQLYHTAHKYDTPQLKSFCLKYLTQNLTEEDVIDAAILAHKYDEMDLMSAAQDFFSMNLGKVVSTTRWATFIKEDFHLTNILIVEMFKNRWRVRRS